MPKMNTQEYTDNMEEVKETPIANENTEADWGFSDFKIPEFNVDLNWGI